MKINQLWVKRCRELEKELNELYDINNNLKNKLYFCYIFILSLIITIGFLYNLLQ